MRELEDGTAKTKSVAGVREENQNTRAGLGRPGQAHVVFVLLSFTRMQAATNRATAFHPLPFLRPCANVSNLLLGRKRPGRKSIPAEALRTLFPMRWWAAWIRRLTILRKVSRLFWCGHRRTTFPLTAGGRTYVCCLACGREFEYNWQGMRRAGERRFSRAAKIESQ